jgi:chromosome segregation ATPase
MPLENVQPFYANLDNQDTPIAPLFYQQLQQLIKRYEDDTDALIYYNNLYENRQQHYLTLIRRYRANFRECRSNHLSLVKRVEEVEERITSLNRLIGARYRRVTDLQQQVRHLSWEFGEVSREFHALTQRMKRGHTAGCTCKCFAPPTS